MANEQRYYGEAEYPQGMVTQEALMQLSPGKENWYKATSTQYFDADSLSFLWKAKVRKGLFIIRGTDQLKEGTGKMIMKLFAILPVVNASGEKLDEATLQRFLSEIVWFPLAALYPYISWREVDENCAEATLVCEGKTVKGTFTFDADGDFQSFSTLRYKDNEPGSERIPWIIEAEEYGAFHGIRIPTLSTVTWQLEKQDWTWLKMRVTGIDYNPAV